MPTEFPITSQGIAKLLDDPTDSEYIKDDPHGMTHPNLHRRVSPQEPEHLEIPTQITDSFTTDISVADPYAPGTRILSLDDKKLYIKKAQYTGTINDWAIFG